MVQTLLGAPPPTVPSESFRSAVFTITQVMADGTIVTSNGLPFPTESYGRFKYCDGAATAQFAGLMAAMLADMFGNQLQHMYIASSGVKHVPSAAANLLQLVIAELTIMDYAPKGVFRVDRGVVKAVDYATLSHEERAQSNAGRQVTLPDVSRREINGHDVVVIDDVRISGSTEAETRRALARTHSGDVYYAYLVLLAEQAAHDASIEDRLNQASVRSLKDLELIVHRPGFMLNARTCKFILRASVEDVRRFAVSIPLIEARKLLAAMVSDGYHRMPQHAEQFAAFASVLPTLVTWKE